MKMNPKACSIGVVGLWHLGCVLSASWSSKGKNVVGLDDDEKLIEDLKKGMAPIFEPNLNETLKKNLRRGNLKFSSDLADLRGCDFVFLSHDTPVLNNDESDLSPLEKTIEDLGRTLKAGAVVIVSSQTPVGTCSEFRQTLKEANPALDLVYSPENLRLGQAIENYLNPGRIVLGVDDPQTEKKILSLFKTIPAKVLPMSLASAEMVKHGINSFLATSITFSNEISDLCELSGADVLDVVKGMKSDPRIGEGAYLSPGIGFSGGTLGRDLKVLESIQSGHDGKINFFKEIHERNALRKEAIVQRLEKMLPQGGLKNRKLGVLGLTYKPGTSTLRRSLPVEIVKLLIKKSAKVSTYDPKANYSEWPGECDFEISKSAEEVLKASDAVLLLTEWPEFRDLQWKQLLRKKNPQVILDAKNCLIDLNLGKMGYPYFRLGKN